MTMLAVAHWQGDFRCNFRKSHGPGYKETRLTWYKD